MHSSLIWYYVLHFNLFVTRHGQRKSNDIQRNSVMSIRFLFQVIIKQLNLTPEQNTS
jgi:hypothetical protein